MSLDMALQQLFTMAHKKVLWTNSSPASNFAAQTLKIPWQNCDLLLVIFRHYATDTYTSTNIIGVTDKVAKINGFLNSKLPQMNAYLYLYGRSYTFVENGIKFEKGYHHDTNSYTPTEGNQYAIPLEIVGIKV